MERFDQDKDEKILKMMMKISNRHSSLLKPQMESILYFVAEWVSMKEMKALQGACMRTFAEARKQQYEGSCPAWMTKRGKNCQSVGKRRKPRPVNSS